MAHRAVSLIAPLAPFGDPKQPPRSGTHQIAGQPLLSPKAQEPARYANCGLEELRRENFSWELFRGPCVLELQIERFNEGAGITNLIGCACRQPPILESLHALLHRPSRASIVWQMDVAAVPGQDDPAGQQQPSPLDPLDAIQRHSINLLACRRMRRHQRLALAQK
jgi:hypothetical protein